MAKGKKNVPKTREELSADLEKPVRTVFVIMPFTRTPTRGELELTEFFQEQLKGKVEGASQLKYKYQVRRSGDAFRINEQLIRDLFRADLVICDLSGEYANPNVMYELGIRLACSKRPVILIREQHPSNQPIFDVQGLHIFDYKPLAPSLLGQYLLQKISAFEKGEEKFESPVLDVLEDEASFERIGHGKARVAAELLEIGLVSQVRVLSREMNRYFKSESLDILLPVDPVQLAPELLSGQAHLESLDWSRFKFALGPHPSVLYYLSTQYLKGIIDDKTEIVFSSQMLRYYEAYFNNVAWWFDFDVRRILAFVQHTLLLAHLCRAIRIMLNSEDGEQAHAQAREWIKEISRSMSWEL